MKGTSVLIVEDHDDVRSLVKAVLERAGMRVAEAEDGRDGLRKFYEQRPEIVVLDVQLPELDGWQVLARIRELSDVPVLMLTAAADELERVRGLRSGADDYVTKPFGRQELVARIETILRRYRLGSAEEAEVYEDDLVTIDFPQRRVSVNGAAVMLTPTEFKLFAELVRHPGQVLSQDQLLERVWGDTHHGARDKVKLYVGYVRRKLREAAGTDPIETVRGFGYRYHPERVPETR